MKVFLLAVAFCGLVHFAGAYERICYVTNWAQYRPDVGSFKPPNINPAYCSHIIYAFAVMDESYRVIPFEWNDDGPGNLYEQLNSWKNSFPALKTLIAVGGWNFGMEIPSRMLATQANRAVFINSAIQFCRQRNFDGFDLDFEYPGGRGSPPEDRERFTMLVRELRVAFDNETPPPGKSKLLLTAAVGAGRETVDAGYEIDKISQDLDFINLMAYDFFGAFDPETGLNAPLYPRADQIGTPKEFWNTAWASEYWVSRGCPKEKLMVGLATYGRCFTLASSAENGLPVPAVGPCKNGTWTREAGFLSYYEICQLISVPDSVTVYHEEHRAPYTYVGDQWVGYDNEQSLVEKVEFINSMGYGGWMVWNMDLDDFTGSFCGKGQYPLMRAINDALRCSAPASTTPAVPTTPPPPTQSTSTPTTTTPTTTTTSTSTPTTPTTPTTTTTSSSSTASTPTEISERYKRVCYVSNWAQYRPGDGKFTPKDINAALCTHIIYAFAKITSENSLAAFEWNDDVLYAELHAHKAYNPKLKTLIAVGGWNFGMTQVSLMMSSAVTRQQFITSSIQFCRFYGFEGLDLDFEYPGFDTSPPEDKQRFTSLVQELREAFDAEAQQSGKPKLLLTAAVAAGKEKIDAAYEIDKIAPLLDFINLMTYDYNGAWDNVTGVNAPLYPRADEIGTHRETLNVDFSVRYWQAGGCPADKLVVGMGTYGRCFTLQSSAVTGLGAAVKGPCMAGTYTREAGFLSYYEICDMIRNPFSSTVYSAEHDAVYTYIADQWVGYDNVGSLTKKVEYVVEKNLGGWMIWNLDLDDFTALHCGAGTYPLSKALNQILLGEVPTQSATTVPTTSKPFDSSQSSTSATTRASGGTGFCSGKADGQYANPDSCTSYYNCHAGTGGLTPCSSMLYYDTDKRVCSWDYQLSAARRAECGLP